MFGSKTLLRSGFTLLLFFAVGIATGQNSTPAVPSLEPREISPDGTIQHVLFEDFVDSVIQQERNLTDRMRNLNPIIETYIQEEGSQFRYQRGITPNGDDYFLGRLNLTGKSPSVVPFADEETWNRGVESYFVHEQLPFSQAAFAQALFPDFGQFDRQNYIFEFVRSEILGQVRCAVVDVRPKTNVKNRGFVGRIWVEDHDYGIVRFKGSFTSNGLSKRAFHFDSWRENLLGTLWMPAYVYTEESKPHDLSGRALWFRAQTRIWGYDSQTVAGPNENGGRMFDGPQTLDSEELVQAHIPDETTYSPEDIAVERSQVAGLIAPEGSVDQILQTVLRNIMITNGISTPGVRCRVLLTTPLESFVIGRTIVVSRGILDVLPNEASLAAVLSHELAHVVLGHVVSSAYLTGFALPFPDSQIFAALDFHFDRAQEAAAIMKGSELFSRSSYKDELASLRLFLRALDASSGQFPELLRGRFSNDFRSAYLWGMQSRVRSSESPSSSRLDQIAALPIGSRIVLDAWSDRIELLKGKPTGRVPKPGKSPFALAPFYPNLRRIVKQH